MFDLEAVHGGALGNDRFEQHAQGRNIPLAVTQVVKQPSLGMLQLDLEDVIKRPACGQHAKLTVEDNEGFDDRIDDGLRQRLSVLELGNGIDQRGHENSSCQVLYGTYRGAVGGIIGPPGDGRCGV